MILLVDDDNDLRDALAKTLRRDGHEVVTAADGLLALRAIGCGLKPSLILLDWRMPVLSGREFLERRSSVAALREIPVVLLAATSVVEAGELQREGLPVVRKPFDVESLLRLVNTMTPPS